MHIILIFCDKNIFRNSCERHVKGVKNVIDFVKNMEGPGKSFNSCNRTSFEKRFGEHTFERAQRDVSVWKVRAKII